MSIEFLFEISAFFLFCFSFTVRLSLLSFPSLPYASERYSWIYQVIPALQRGAVTLYALTLCQTICVSISARFGRGSCYSFLKYTDSKKEYEGFSFCFRWFVLRGYSTSKRPILCLCFELLMPVFCFSWLLTAWTTTKPNGPPHIHEREI